MFPSFDKAQVKKRSSQSLQMRGINLTDAYTDGQLESCRGISSERFPYITTADKLTPVETGIPSGYHAVSMYAWDKLFVVSNEQSESGGYKCYYGGEYCGDAENLEVPKQYAVVNTQLVMFPDKVAFTKTDHGVTSRSLNSSSMLKRVDSGVVVYRRAVES